MPYTQQTLTGRETIYNAIITFLTTDATLVANGEAWSQASAYSGDYGTGVYLQSPESGGVSFYILIYHNHFPDTDSHVIGMRTYFSLNVDAATDINSGFFTADKWSITAVSDTTSSDLLLVANGRRITGFVSNNGNYQNFYVGMFLPFCEPQYYPRPILCVGTGLWENHNVNWTVTSRSDSGGFIFLSQNPNQYSYTGETNLQGGGFYNEQGTFIRLAGTGTSSTDPIRFFPSYDDYSWHYDAWYKLTTSEGGYSPLFPVLIYEADGEEGGNPRMYGELDGVRWPPQINQVPDRQITDENGHVWVVTQDGVNGEPGRFAAIRLL